MSIKNSKSKYLINLPRKRVCSGVLLFDDDDKLLVLKPSYKTGWTIPGGTIEDGESPLETAIREVREEVGLEIGIKKCLNVNYKECEYDEYKDESLQFLFLGETLKEDKKKNIKIDNNEIIDYKFVEFDVALNLFNENSKRKLSLLKSRGFKDFYSENGDIPF